MGILVGRVFDAGHLYVDYLDLVLAFLQIPYYLFSHYMIVAGSALQVVSMPMLSLATTDNAIRLVDLPCETITII